MGRMAETMYAMKPVFELDADIEVPKCMYSLPVIQCSNHIPGVGSGVGASSGTTTCPPGALQALEARQDAILARLEKLKAEVEAYKKTLGLPAQCDSSSTSSQAPVCGRTPDLVVRCSPSHPAFSLKGVYNLLSGAGLSVHTSCHTHSSVPALPPQCQSFLPEPEMSRTQAQVRITLIWKEVGRDCELMVSPLTQTLIRGEVNILRYIARLFPTLVLYENLTNISSVDSMLDSVSSLLWVQPRDRQPLMRTLVTQLGRSTYLAGEQVSITDLALYSVVRQLGLDKELQPELARWFTKAANHLGVKSGGRNRNSSMRKSCGSLKRNERRSSEKEKSPKKEVNKKGKSPVKEVKVEKKPQKKTD